MQRMSVAVLVALVMARGTQGVRCTEGQVYACGRCWASEGDVRLSAACETCYGDRDCKDRSMYCGMETNPEDETCGNVRVCLPGAEYNHACTPSLGSQTWETPCVQRGCGFNLYCKSLEPSTVESRNGRCEFVNDQPLMCFTECGRVVPHDVHDAPADDGCNTCSCFNGALRCTEKHCTAAKPPCPPLQQGDACNAATGVPGFSPGFNRMGDCPAGTDCKVDMMDGEMFHTCKPACFTDDDCDRKQFCRIEATRGGCLNSGKCVDRAKKNDRCFDYSPCSRMACRKGLKCINSACLKVN